MARLLRELVRRQSSNRFIATLTNQTPSIASSPSLFLQKPFIGQPKFDHGGGGGLNPSSEDLTNIKEVAHLSKLQIYPSFSLGFFLDPVLPYGSGSSQIIASESADVEHPGTMWADSVKKKRKTKMNKHKYKKLRKRLRRKTKT